MIRLLADENFNVHVVRGVLRENPAVDFVDVREVGLQAFADPAVLEWAAKNGRVVVSHDQRTLVPFAYERVTAGLPMPGVIIARRRLAIRRAISDLITIAICGEAQDFADRVISLPL